jgi:transcriptional regulator with XRE-family HTH domain
MAAQPLEDRLQTIKTRSGISAREIAQLVGTSPQTVSRWHTGKASPQPKALRRLLFLDWVADQLAEFYEPKTARLWLFSHHPLLGGDRPADRIAEDRFDEVLALLEQLQTAAYA